MRRWCVLTSLVMSKNQGHTLPRCDPSHIVVCDFPEREREFNHAHVVFLMFARNPHKVHLRVHQNFVGASWCQTQNIRAR